MTKTKREAQGRLPEVDVSDDEWVRLPTGEALAEELIRKYHPHLERAHVLVFAKPKGDKKKAGELALCTPAERALLRENGEEGHYKIIVGMDRWVAWSDRDRMILIDHELCHATGLNLETDKWTKDSTHDIEEFHQILDRYGAYSPSLKKFATVAAQLVLPMN